MAEKIRLQKYLSEHAVASRRKSEELIRQGRVKINGRTAGIGDKVDEHRDIITVDGKKVKRPPEKVYIMLNKPRGYTTTMSDELGRRCVADLVRGVHERLYPVGRLDRDSEGLIIMTNDGELANRVMHPSGSIYKTYRVTVAPPVSQEQIDALINGVELDGRITAKAIVDIITEEPERAVLKIAICEGRNRQIRRMCEAVGLEVKRLKRTAIGGLKLGMLPPGRWEKLDEQEMGLIFKTAGPKEAPDTSGHGPSQYRKKAQDGKNKLRKPTS